MEDTNAHRSWTIVTVMMVVVALGLCVYFYYHYSPSSTSRARLKNKDDLPPSTDEDDRQDAHIANSNTENGAVDPFFTPLYALGTNSARTDPALL